MTKIAATKTEPAHNIYGGVECANGLIANGEAQELGWLLKNPGKTIRDGVRAAGRASVWGGRCWKVWESLTREERLDCIRQAYEKVGEDDSKL